jgi:hypothetical protein
MNNYWEDMAKSINTELKDNEDNPQSVQNPMVRVGQMIILPYDIDGFWGNNMQCVHCIVAIIAGDLALLENGSTWPISELTFIGEPYRDYLQSCRAWTEIEGDINDGI